MKWETIDIETDHGIETAVAPLIISASRATDLPAFHVEWFLDALQLGYVRRRNPFNGVEYTISFRNCRACVFWSKNPAPLIPHLMELDRRKTAYYFQFSLNDYAREGLEPGLPLLEKRIETFRILSETIGMDRVVWRFDPLILAGSITENILLERIRRIGDRLHSVTRRLVFSFADIEGYARVKRNLTHAGVSWREWTKEGMLRVAEGISGMCRDWGIEAVTCAEEIALDHLGISHSQCIDPELLARITEDEEFRRFLGYRMGLTGLEPMPSAINLKDRGQRKHCGCIVSKDIGAYNTCRHGCRYCYANDVRIHRNIAYSDC